MFARRSLPIMFALILTSTLSSQVLRVEECDRPFPDCMPVLGREGGDLYESHYVTQIIDAYSGRPIAGAEMSLYAEESFPTAGSRRLLGRATADLDGWVRYPRGGLPRHEAPIIVFTADGYAPRGEFRYPESPLELEPGERRLVRFVDEFGRPRVGLRLEHLLGCGHTPAIRVFESDAAGHVTFDGLATVPGVNEFWPRGRNVASDYIQVWDLLRTPEGGDYVLSSAPDIRGRVIDAKGAGVAEARVGVTGFHRGPWVLTADDGSFLLQGVRDDIESILAIPAGVSDFADATSSARSFARPEPEVSVVIRLDETGRIMEPGPTRTLGLVIGETMTDEFVDPDELSFTCFRESDGYTVRSRIDRDKGTTIELPSGGDWHMRLRDERCGLVLVDRALGGAEIDSGQIVISPSSLAGWGWRPGPLLNITTPGGDSEPELFLRLVDHRLPLEELREFEGRSEDGTLFRWSLRLPSSPPPGAELEVRWERRGFPPGVERRPLPEEGATLDLREARLEIRVAGVVGPEGRPVAYTLEARPDRWPGAIEVEHLETDDVDAGPRSIDLPSPPSGWLLVRPRDPNLAPLWLALEGRPVVSGRVDLGELQCRPLPPACITLIDPLGRPARGATVQVEGLCAFEADDQGLVRPLLFRPDELSGRRIRAHQIGGAGGATVDLCADLTGPGPWHLEWPDTELRFRLAHDRGGPISAARVLVAGQDLELSLAEGTATLRGLAPGEHRLVLIVEGEKPRVIELRLRDQVEIPVRFGTPTPPAERREHND